MATALSVNLNKIALLRNARDLELPSIVEAADICINAGAHGLTVHPRPDQRHIRRYDVYALAERAAGRVEYNIEGNPFDDFMDLVLAIRPTQCTLVPDAPGQKTSDHGWDLMRDRQRLQPLVARLQAAGIRVSLFLDPEPTQVELAHALGVERIELYTEPYAAAHGAGTSAEALIPYRAAAQRARELGVGVNAGHDLNLHNLPLLLNSIDWIQEVSIGHALTADALLHFGLHGAVKAYLAALGH